MRYKSGVMSNKRGTLYLTIVFMLSLEPIPTGHQGNMNKYFILRSSSHLPQTQIKNNGNCNNDTCDLAIED